MTLIRAICFRSVASRDAGLYTGNVSTFGSVQDNDSINADTVVVVPPEAAASCEVETPLVPMMMLLLLLLLLLRDAFVVAEKQRIGRVHNSAVSIPTTRTTKRGMMGCDILANMASVAVTSDSFLDLFVSKNNLELGCVLQRQQTMIKEKKKKKNNPSRYGSSLTAGSFVTSCRNRMTSSLLLPVATYS